MKIALLTLSNALLLMLAAPLAPAQTALDPVPRALPESPVREVKDPTELPVRMEAGLITIAGKVYRQASVVAVGAAEVRFISPDGGFTVPWAKVPWNLRTKLESEHAQAFAKGQALAAAQRRRERLAALGLELIEGVVVGKTGGGMLVETAGRNPRTVLLRGHPDQAGIADQDRVATAARAGGTHEYGGGFFAVAKTARVYDCVPGE